jgi:beta-mannosidase
MTDLSGLWTLTDDRAEHAIPFAIPGDGITALHAAGAIPDPYWGRNEYSLRWIADRDWTATRRFQHDGTPCDLIVDHLDTVAEILLNGTLVLSAANSFRRFRVEATGLRAGENEIAITFRSATRAADATQAAQPFRVPYAAQNCPIPNGNMLRKVQCDFGWDWNIALAPFGLYGRIALEPKGDRIDDILVTQTHEFTRATVTVKVHTNAEDVTATLCNQTVKATPPTSGGPQVSVPRRSTNSPSPRAPPPPPAASACATSNSSANPTRPGDPSPFTSTATLPSRAARTGFPPTPSQAGSRPRKPARCCDRPSTATRT